MFTQYNNVVASLCVLRVYASVRPSADLTVRPPPRCYSWSALYARARNCSRLAAATTGRLPESPGQTPAGKSRPFAFVPAVVVLRRTVVAVIRNRVRRSAVV